MKKGLSRSRGKEKSRFESADGGTLFLDEIGNIPIEVQERFCGWWNTVPLSEWSPERVMWMQGSSLQPMATWRALWNRGVQRDLLDRLSLRFFTCLLCRTQGGHRSSANHFAVRMAMNSSERSCPGSARRRSEPCRIHLAGQCA